MNSPACPIDRLGRALRNLRISVTDHCNLRCSYCMPEDDHVWLAHEDILRYEEISILADVFLSVGADRFRITGGEPLLRRDLPDLIRMLAAKPGLRDLAMTTNALRLTDRAAELRSAGLQRLTISLDTLRPERFRALTGRDGLARVISGIDAAVDAGFSNTKVNTVVIRGFNADELESILEYGRERGVEVRFIEYMDVVGATQWRIEDVVPREEILERLSRHFGEITPVKPADSSADVREIASEQAAPADRYRLLDGTVFGIVASTTSPFCRDCVRSRLTADGMWYLCLYATDGLDLRGPLRSGAPPAEIARIIGNGWGDREERGAELGLAGREAGTAGPDRDGRGDPHLEMHTRGG